MLTSLSIFLNFCQLVIIVLTGTFRCQMKNCAYLTVSQVITVLLVLVDLISLKYCVAAHTVHVQFSGIATVLFRSMLLTLITTESVH